MKPTRETSGKFIQVKGLHYSINNKNILNGIDMFLEKDEAVSLIGPNGSGKTTLGKAIMGIIKPSSGNVFINGKSISEYSLSETGEMIGYLFQNPSRQIFAITVYEELSFKMKFNRVDPKIIEDSVERVINEFELEKIRDCKCYTLSQGEKQRLALAAIFINNPRYLILDEPTTSLDKTRKGYLGSLLKKINQKGIGIFMMSHDMDFVNQHSNRIIKMSNGCVADA